MEILKKSRSILVAMLFASSMGNAQTSFYHIFSGNGYDKGEGIAQLADSSYLVTGSSSSFEDAPSQALLLKLDKNGFHQWSKVYGGAEFESGRRVIPVENYGYYIIGTSSSNNHAFDGYIVFTDLSGNQLWEQWYDFNGAWERFNDALLLPDTSLILIGETTNNPDELSDRLLMRVDKMGNVLWSNQMTTTGNDFLQKGALTSDSTFVIVGTVYNADSLQNKAYIASFHKNGTLIWDTVTGKNGNYQLNDIQFEAGNFVAAGEKIQTGKSDQDEYTVFITGAGLVYSEYDFYSPSNDRVVGFVNYTASPGNKYFTGIESSNSAFTFAGGEDFVISRYAAGFFWDGYGLSYSGFGQDQMNHIIQTKDSFAICVGFHSDEGFSPGGNSLFVLKLGSGASFPTNDHSYVYNILKVGEESFDNAQIQVYPNPFSGKLNIESKSEIQAIRVLDMAGRELLSLDNNNTIDTNDWNAGFYIVQVKSNNQWSSKKVCKQ